MGPGLLISEAPGPFRMFRSGSGFQWKGKRSGREQRISDNFSCYLNKFRLVCFRMTNSFSTFSGSTHMVKPVPDGFHTVTPHLVISGAAEALDWYKKAFGRTEITRKANPGGRL